MENILKLKFERHWWFGCWETKTKLLKNGGLGSYLDGAGYTHR